LLTFRKNKLSNNNSKDFYDNIIQFAEHVSTNRGVASGSKIKIIGQNTKVKSNIIGFFDGLSPKQKWKLTKKNIKHPRYKKLRSK
jgi:hypothetical protein